jgi:uncharacterized protein YjbI with pentapeptide repeats
LSVPPTLERLSHEAVERILEQHARFLATAGVEGERADFSLYEVDDFQFRGLDLHDVQFQSAIFLRCSFAETNLAGADFDRTMAPRIDFSRASLWRAEIYSAEFPAALFDGANLEEAVFVEADLSGASFRGARLARARFAKCKLDKCVFEGTNLSHTVFELE